jgi:hypothetical protein
MHYAITFGAFRASLSSTDIYAEIDHQFARRLILPAREPQIPLRAPAGSSGEAARRLADELNKGEGLAPRAGCYSQGTASAWK